MTIRDRVEFAIKDKWLHAESSVPGQECATAAITAFLEAAAEEGWRMCRDEATEEMAHEANGFGYRSEYTARQNDLLREKYRAILEAGPEFEWDK